MWNERKGNILIWIELVVIASFMWYTIDSLYITYKRYNRPIGFDINHTYNLTIETIGEESDEYDPVAFESNTPGDYLGIMLDRISRHPGVEAVCYTLTNHFHYRGQNQSATFKSNTLMRNGYVRDVSASYFRVFQVRSANNNPVEDLEKALGRRDVIVTSPVADAFFGNSSNAINKDILCFVQNEDSAIYQIGGVCEAQRYSEFSNNYDYAFYRLISPDWVSKYASPVYLRLFIRIKPNSDGKTFPETFRKEMREQLQIGNFYLADVRPMSFYRTAYTKKGMDEIRMNLSVVGFFLLNILLGVAGTFWLRTQRKKSEIGLRMAIGSTRPGIARLLFLEGNTLLLAAFIPATLIFINLQYAGVTEQANWLPLIPRLLTVMIITYLLLAVMIGIGIVFPARRAVKVNPVEGLRDE